MDTQVASGDRGQDVGRSHKRRPKIAEADRSRLAKWRETLRRELDMVVDALDALQPVGLIDVPRGPNIPLPDKLRDQLIERGIRVARELGAEVDPPAPEKPRERRAPRVGGAGFR